MTALVEPAAGRAPAEPEATGRIPGLRPVAPVPPAAVLPARTTRRAPAASGTDAPAAAEATSEAEAPGSEAPGSEAPGSGASRAAARRSVRRPPGRRGALWLAALVVGAVVAAVPGFTGSTAGPVTASAADYGLGAADLGFTGDMDDAGVRQGITQAEAAVRLSELAASRAAREPETVLPTSGRMTTCFCMRWGSMHYGIDLAAPLGTPIFAATDGVVLRAGRASGYGNAVYIQDADGNVHVYGHMRYYDVAAGDIVHAGDQIAKVGNEGQSTGPHLHYEIHRGGMTGRPIDPEEFLAERGVTV
ncbi:Peptidase family M23 [Geodermatophilus saharensis]|uniref:Peptidase family M23 n=1 Tax=Geodermatophilus saharensis TaxID=1137994 RepID=A0A238ZUL2_9ACTN|nr:M23 family metallopeptidase [Geodermatophilus saharensis]SNR86919.1 Peptidase family M23 [Geodermatophilus saharensis]